MMNNGIDDEFVGNVAANIEIVGNLLNEIDIDTMEPKARDLVNNLMIAITQNKMISNAMELKNIELNNILLGNERILATSAYFLSTFIEDKGLAAEFMEYATAKQTNASLCNVDELAENSFCDTGLNGMMSPEQSEASQKTSTLYDALKGSIPQELHKLLFDLRESMDEYNYIEAHTAYLQGFNEAVKSLNGTELHG